MGSPSGGGSILRQSRGRTERRAQDVCHRVIPAISCRELEGELILFNSLTGKVHHLNMTASLIFCLCDGAHSEKSILRELQTFFRDEDAKKLEADLSHTLSYLKRHNVICSDASS